MLTNVRYVRLKTVAHGTVTYVIVTLRCLLFLVGEGWHRDAIIFEKIVY